MIVLKKEKKTSNLEFQSLMKDYHIQTKKRANRGLKITNQFKKWIKENFYLDENEKQQLIEYCNYYDSKMKKVVGALVLFSNIHIKGIKNDLEAELAIFTSPETVKKFIKGILPTEYYRKRFNEMLRYPDHVNAAIDDAIINTELSLGKIAEKVTEATGIDVILHKVLRNAKNKLSNDEYEKRFPADRNKYSEVVEDEIEYMVKSTTLITEEISQEIKNRKGINVSHYKIRRIAKKNLSKEEYQSRFPASENKYSEELELMIEEAIMYSDLTQREIAEALTKKTGLEVSASKVRNKAKEVLSQKKYKERFPYNFYKELGNIMHPVLEDILIDVMEQKGITVLNEIKLNNTRVHDNIIIVNGRFKEEFPIQLPPQIKYISIDYSLDTTQRNFEIKCKKKYQSENTQFYFVPISFKRDASDYEIPKELPFNNNIKVIPIKDFINFFKFDEKNSSLLRLCIDKVLKVKNSRKQTALMNLKEFFEKTKLSQKLITEFKEVID